MLLRNKIWIVAAILAVLIAGGWYQVNKWARASAIERVLVADHAAAQRKNSYADVVRDMQKIRLEGCPSDFKLAYRRHIQAWESAAEVERQVGIYNEQSSSVGMYAEAFIRGLLGDPLGKANELAAAQNQLRQEAQRASQSIKDTWVSVEESATAYGVEMPQFPETVGAR